MPASDAQDRQLRDVIAENLRALRDSGRAGLGKIKAISERSGVSNGAVGRLMKPERQEWTDNFEKVAHALDVEPWQLLVPDLLPSRLPRLADQTPTVNAEGQELKVLAALAKFPDGPSKDRLMAKIYQQIAEATEALRASESAATPAKRAPTGDRAAPRGTRPARP